MTLALYSFERPLFEYLDYRQVMGDFYEIKKKHFSSFSYRRFSQLCGFSSPNFLLLVIQGKKNLSLEGGKKVAKVMGLKNSDSSYFLGLLREQTAKNEEERRQGEREKLRALKKMRGLELSVDRAAILKHWYYLPIREMAFLPDFGPTAAYVLKKIGGLISTQEAEEAIYYLYQSGFWQKDLNGKTIVQEVALDTGDKQRMYSYNLGFHKQTLQLWSKHLEKGPQNLRELSCLNIPISYKNLQLLKQKMLEFQEEIFGLLMNETEPETLVQLGLYLFPLEGLRPT